MRVADMTGWRIDRIYTTPIPGTSSEGGKEGSLVGGAVGSIRALRRASDLMGRANRSDGNHPATICDLSREGEITFGDELVHTSGGAECFFTKRR